jgi:hypothetical protein
MPTPSSTPNPAPKTYCEALMQISETPFHFFQCSPNQACDKLECPIDLFADGQLFKVDISVVAECEKNASFVIELFSPTGGSLWKISANVTGLYMLLTLPLFTTINQTENFIGVQVS